MHLTDNPAHRFATELIRAGDPHAARTIQQELRRHCIFRETIDVDEIRHVAGADAGYTKESVCAAVVVMAFPGLDVVEKACSVQKIPFPYIPGLLSFREGPAVIDAFARLTCIPDLMFLNGHGYAHPQRIGIASHIGVVLDLPAIGVAQRLLTGASATPGERRGSTAPVLENHEVIGMAVRTKEGTKPLYVSAGHKVDLVQAVDLMLRMTTTHRFPEPLWCADRLSRQCKKDLPG